MRKLLISLAALATLGLASTPTMAKEHGNDRGSSIFESNHQDKASEQGESHREKATEESEHHQEGMDQEDREDRKDMRGGDDHEGRRDRKGSDREKDD